MTEEVLRGEQRHIRGQPRVAPRPADPELCLDRAEDVLERYIVDEDSTPRDLLIKCEPIHVLLLPTKARPAPGDKGHPLAQFELDARDRSRYPECATVLRRLGVRRIRISSEGHLLIRRPSCK